MIAYIYNSKLKNIIIIYNFELNELIYNLKK